MLAVASGISWVLAAVLTGFALVNTGGEPPLVCMPNGCSVTAGLPGRIHVVGLVLGGLSLLLLIVSVIGFLSLRLPRSARVGLWFMLVGVLFIWALGLGISILAIGLVILSLGVRRTDLPSSAPAVAAGALLSVFGFVARLDDPGTDPPLLIVVGMTVIAFVGVGWAWFGLGVRRRDVPSMHVAHDPVPAD